MYLLRTIENREGGSFEHRDNEYSGNEITIGRATDRDIQLTEHEVALNHAVISLRGKGGGIIKSASSTSTISVNDKVVRRSLLQPGDTIRISESVLKVIRPPTGFDFALTLERGAEEIDEDALPGSRYVSSLADAGLRKRRWSWALFLLILVVFLVIPASGLFDQRLQAVLRSTPLLPDDGVWEAGSLSRAHSIPGMSENCNVCHVRPFVAVRDEQCIACHVNIGKHASAGSPDG